MHTAVYDDAAVNEIIEPVVAFYTRKFEEHGIDPRGVDWPAAAPQERRFEQFLHLLPRPGVPFTLLDYGCGYGALLTFLNERGYSAHYKGYDRSKPMIAAAREIHRRPTAFTSEPPDGSYDYVVASGIFNVKLDAPEALWHQMMLATLDRFNELARRGFAFNVLSSRREPHRKQPHLFYGDPAELLRRCLEQYSPEASLLHDYGLWDLTLLVRKLPA